MKSVALPAAWSTASSAYWEASPSPVSPSTTNDGSARSVRSMRKSGRDLPYQSSSQSSRWTALGSLTFLARKSFRASQIVFRWVHRNPGLFLLPGGSSLFRSRAGQRQPAPATESREVAPPSPLIGHSLTRYCDSQRSRQHLRGQARHRGSGAWKRRRDEAGAVARVSRRAGPIRRVNRAASVGGAPRHRLERPEP